VVKGVSISGADGASERGVKCGQISGADGASDCGVKCVFVSEADGASDSGLESGPFGCLSYTSGRDMGGAAVAVALIATEWLRHSRVVTSSSLASALS
jgi:hypothetical protein